LGVIKILESQVANKIAAGEVVQRPASAVKELLENSIDSKADEIILSFNSGGNKMFQVSDNGCGMDFDDLNLCIKRHATSKIKTSQDLNNIKTMGFRGEALASISEISIMEIKTKSRDHDIGNRVLFSSGTKQKAEPFNAQQGTSIKVENIFFNLPARKKFLKSEKIESKHIIEEFKRVAIINYEINFICYENGKEIFKLKKAKFLNRILEINKLKINNNYVPVNEETSIVKIFGYIAKPELAKKTRGEQYLFVNKRFFKSNYFSHAIKSAFKGLIDEKKIPTFYINFEINPSQIDVNIHPNKTEIKFSDEKSIYSILRSAVKKSLAQYNLIPSIDFNLDQAFFDELDRKPKKISVPNIKIDKSYNPFHEDSQNTNSNFLNNLFSESDDSFNSKTKNNLFQIENFMISIEFDSLKIFSIRKMHKRVLYENYLNFTAENNSINLLFPIDLFFSENEISTIKGIKNSLNKFGFKYVLKEKMLSVLAIPSNCDETKIRDYFEDFIESKTNNTGIETDLKIEIAKKLCNRNAYRPKIKLSKYEMEALYASFHKCKNQKFCPSGKKIWETLLVEHITKLIKP